MATAAAAGGYFRLFLIYLCNTISGLFCQVVCPELFPPFIYPISGLFYQVDCPELFPL